MAFGVCWRLQPADQVPALGAGRGSSGQRSVQGREAAARMADLMIGAKPVMAGFLNLFSDLTTCEVLSGIIPRRPRDRTQDISLMFGTEIGSFDPRPLLHLRGGRRDRTANYRRD